MTGYGKAAFFSEEFDIEIEVKSVNNRFLDLKLMLPRELSSLEMLFRQKIKSFINRGKVDIRLNINDKRIPKLVLNEERLNSFKEIYSKINEKIGSSNGIPLEVVLRENGIVTSEAYEIDGTSYAEALLDTLGKALIEHQKMAINEGESMQDFLVSSLSRINTSLGTIENEFPEYKQDLFMKFKKQISELLNSVLDEDTEKRILVETAMYIEKADVNEEIVRLYNHIEKFRNKLYLNDVEIGKSLNFILQEMHREINTIGSKFNSSNVFSQVLTIKEEIEKCREMVQNVE
jgi:uncharacterized protein (TIGR00255 family)